MSEKILHPVLAVQDRDCHWYIMPKSLIHEWNDMVFEIDRAKGGSDEEQETIDAFERAFGKYRMCGWDDNGQQVNEKNLERAMALQYREWGWYVIPESLYDKWRYMDLRIGQCEAYSEEWFNERKAFERAFMDYEVGSWKSNEQLYAEFNPIKEEANE